MGGIFALVCATAAAITQRKMPDRGRRARSADRPEASASAGGGGSGSLECVESSGRSIRPSDHRTLLRAQRLSVSGILALACV